MPWTQADVDALDAAYKSGAEQTTLADGRSVRLRSYEEYLALRRLMQDEIAGAAGVTVSKLVRVGLSRGLV